MPTDRDTSPLERTPGAPGDALFPVARGWSCALLLLLTLLLFGPLAGLFDSGYVDGDFSIMLEAPYQFAKTGNLAIPSSQDPLLNLKISKIVLHPPLHYLLTGIAFKVFGIGISQAQAMTLAQLLLTVLVVSCFARSGWNLVSGLGALAFCSASYFFWYQVGLNTRPDMLCALLAVASAFCFALSETHRRWALYLASGTLFGLAFLSHGNASCLFFIPILHSMLRRWMDGTKLRRSLRLAIPYYIGAATVLAAYLLWLNKDLLPALSAINNVFFFGTGEGIHRNAQNVLYHGDILKYAYDCIHTEIYFRWSDIARHAGLPFIVALLAGDALFIFLFSRRRLSRPVHSSVLSYLVVIAFFSLFRNNKSGSYDIFLLSPMILAASIAAGYLFTATARRLRSDKLRLAWKASAAVLLAAFALLGARDKVAEIQANHASYAPYTKYTRLIERIMRPGEKAIGDHRFWFGLRDDGYDLLWYQYEIGWKSARELNSLLHYGWLVLSDDQTMRFRDQDALAQVQAYFQPVADMIVPPYGHTTIYRRKGRPVDEPFPGIAPPVDVAYRDGRFLVTPRQGGQEETLHPEAWSQVSDAASLRAGDGGLLLRTGPKANGYQFESPAFASAPGRDRLVAIDLEVDVLHGGGALGALSADRSRWLANSVFTSPGSNHVRLGIPEGDDYILVFQNVSTQDTASEYLIRSLKRISLPYHAY